ncbi:hypothetical protein [Desulforegula conservatrix]|uniref:hypothetical protein n=1 Tax=Desulforegula conservatrix TaxID=153026 RepID=UPI000483E5EA|nr:hypothetical protein [Desulforegula conservatrix]
MCILHVTSNTDSFKEFIKSTSLPVLWSYEKGDDSSKGKRPPKDHYAFACDVSKKEWNNFSGQVSDSIAFLQNNFAELKKLIKLYRIDDIRLDFPVESQLIRNELFSQCDFLPSELIKLAGQLNMGIEISQYWPAEDE